MIGAWICTTIGALSRTELVQIIWYYNSIVYCWLEWNLCMLSEVVIIAGSIDGNRLEGESDAFDEGWDRFVVGYYKEVFRGEQGTDRGPARGEHNFVAFSGILSHNSGLASRLSPLVHDVWVWVRGAPDHEVRSLSQGWPTCSIPNSVVSWAYFALLFFFLVDT